MDSTPVVQAPAVPAIAEDGAPVGNVLDQATANRIARANSVSVTVEELILAAAAIHKLPYVERDLRGRTQCLAEMFTGQGYKVLAVFARLEAMVKIIRSGRVSHWASPEAPDGGSQVADPVFLAAVSEPILFAEYESYFEPESFIASVLENAAVDGHA
jgi:hypothetical protein